MSLYYLNGSWKHGPDRTMLGKLTSDETDTRAVSPVIGVILLVGITVVLGTVLGLLVLDMGQGQMSDAEEPLSADEPEDTDFRFPHDTEDGTTEVTYRDGPDLDAERVYVAVDGQTHEWREHGTIEAGDSVEVPHNGDSGEILVVWEHLDDQKTLASDDY